jgi:Holliday junction DNA helicase RuvA
MIDTVQGILETRGEDSVRIGIGGVGLEIITPKPTGMDLGPLGSVVTLYTHVYVKDENITLFGFKDVEARSLFRSLNGVSGVGPRLALSILSSIHSQALYSAIEAEDVQALQEIPGIGKRTASRIIVDLKGKLTEVSSKLGDSEAALTSNDPDLSFALRGLGYSAIEIRDTVRTMDVEPNLSLEEKIRNALQILSSNNEN